MKKRILSLLLALVMCLSLLPTAAFAEGGIDTTGGTDGDTTITGSTGDTGDSTAAPTGKDEDKDEDKDTDSTVGAPTPLLGAASTPVVLAGFDHTNHCLCGATHIEGSGHSATGTDWSPLIFLPSYPDTNKFYYLTENVTLSGTLKFEGTGKNFYLCLNGHTITADGDFPAITVSGGATLFLTDCGGGEVTYNDRTTEGCTVKVAGGTFKLYNGTITHAAGTSGSGVRVESGGKFEMYGGKITGNSGTTTDYDKCGGGVYIEPVKDSAPGGTFNMYGGTISGNEATNGGGVLLGDYGTFNMTGGEISGNTANEGGGVYVAGGRLNTACDHVTFEMSGGKITGNNAAVNGGGVYGAGAYHGFDSLSATIPSTTASTGNTFKISGNANVTGNTVGGTKGSDGKYTDGTKNNMYVRTWIYSIYVVDGFSGSFGVTVDEGDWSDKVDNYGTARHGTYWQVVKYKLGVSETYSSLPSGINYDNERFSFELSGANRGRLNCKHFGEASGNNTTGYECSICGSTAVDAEVTFADKTKRCYELLQNAISEADNGGTVKMLDKLEVDAYDTKYPLDMNGKSVTLDMNGKTIKVNLVPITIEDGTLDITGNAGKIDCSGGLQVANGAKLIVSGQPEINSLTVQSGGAAQLKGGKYGSITAPEGKTCLDLLADGYAFFRSGSLLDGSANNFPAVEGALITIVSHTCDGFNDGKCNACGRTCPHSSIGTDGKCTGCTMQMVAQVTKTTGGIAGEIAYFTGFKGAVDSIKSGDTNVTIKLLTADAVSTDLTIDKACTLDLNRQTLTVDTGRKLTVNSTVTIRSASDATIVEGGQIAGTVAAGASADLTIEGDLTIGELTAAVSATVQLKGGTFESISIKEEGTDESSKTIASLLAPGYAFASTTTGSDEPRDLYGSLGTDGQDLTVVQCVNHGMYDNETNCMFCNTEFAVSVNVGNVSGAQPYYCQTLSEAMTYINGKTNNVDNVPNDTTTQINITLLGNVTEQDGSNKTITFNRSNPLELNLNGKTLTADIEVASNTTLTMRGSGTLAGTLDVRSGGNAKLFNGTFNKITVADGSSVNALLGENCGYYSKEADDSKTWLMSDDARLNDTSLENISVQLIPIKSVSISPYMSTYGYGTTTWLTANDVTGFDDKKITNGVTYQWYKVEGETKSKLSGATSDSYQTSNDLAVGEHTFRCEVTVDGYTVGKAVDVTVNKITLNSDTYYPTANTLTFATQNIGGSNPTAKAQQLVTAPTATLPDGCKVYYRVGTTGEFAETIPTATDAGTYTVYWYIDASGNGNYDGVGSKDEPRELSVTIAPMKVAKTFPTGNPDGIKQLYLYHKDGDAYSNVPVTYTYTGSEIRPEFQLQNADGYVIASGYSVTYGNNIKASSFGNSATITIKDTNPNDNFEIQDSTFLFDIALKSVTLTPDPYTYYAKKPENGSISFDLTDIAKALGMPEDDGELEFKLSVDVLHEGMALSGTNNATLTIASPEAKTYTATVLVSSNNHKGNFTLNVEVSEKTVPTINVNAFTKTYDGAAVTLDDVTKNATVTATGVTSNIEGAWSWNAPEGKPKDVADSNNYLLTFTPTDTTNYTSATATVQVTIAPLKILIAGADLKPKTYDGKTDVEFGTGGVTFKKEDAPNTPVTLTMGTDYTATATLSNPYANETRAQVSVKLLTGNYRFGNYDEATKNITCQVSPAPLKVTAQAAPKTYDGDTSVDSYNVSFKGIVTGDSLDPTKDYTVTAAFADADAGTGKKVIVTVTLSETVFGQRYCFMVDDKASRTISVETTADIDPLPLTTPPTAKESIVRIRQDVSVPDGSYLLSENVSGVLPDGFELSGELRFALGNDLPAKLEAQIDENTGMLTYTISGGRSGEKFAIPVTLTMPNFVYDTNGGAAAVALFALNDDQVQETDPNAGTITIGFTVEIELTGGSHHHIRRQPTGTGTTSGGANNGSTGGNGSGVASPATGDAGIALYGVLAVLSMTGGAWIRRKKR